MLFTLTLSQMGSPTQNPVFQKERKLVSIGFKYSKSAPNIPGVLPTNKQHLCQRVAIKLDKYVRGSIKRKVFTFGVFFRVAALGLLLPLPAFSMICLLDIYLNLKSHLNRALLNQIGMNLKYNLRFNWIKGDLGIKKSLDMDLGRTYSCNGSIATVRVAGIGHP